MTTFVGIKMLKDQTAGQNAKFRAWLDAGLLQNFGPDEHFDWWAFPIDRPSRRYGEKYDISVVLDELRSDAQFLGDVLGNARMLMAAWGWDLDSARSVDETLYPRYGVRLWKCGLSLHVLGMPRAFLSVQSFAVSHREERTSDTWAKLELSEANPVGVDIARIP